MRYALVNPRWDFAGSTYFGCREPHLPLELLFSEALLRSAGHDTLLVDAHLLELSVEEVRRRLASFEPEVLVLPTAPTYLFWRCPPPEQRVPMAWFRALEGPGTLRVGVGPHGSATPRAALHKLGCDVILRGECEPGLLRLATDHPSTIEGCCWRDRDGVHLTPGLAAQDMKTLPALHFRDYPVELHRHRHHVFTGEGRGAELELARGCPWSCTFCNKELFRDRFRERRPEDVLAEVDALAARGVDYVYFIDEIFGGGRASRALLLGLRERPIQFGVQTRIDLWDEASLDLLASAGCISVEVGLESITPEGRSLVHKGCRMDTDRMCELLLLARRLIPWVQANLIEAPDDDRAAIAAFRSAMIDRGVWVSEPVPMFPYPGSPLYRHTFHAEPDERAWERAHEHYVRTFQGRGFSDIQEQRPLPLEVLECAS